MRIILFTGILGAFLIPGDACLNADVVTFTGTIPSDEFSSPASSPTGESTYTEGGFQIIFPVDNSPDPDYPDFTFVLPGDLPPAVLGEALGFRDSGLTFTIKYFGNQLFELLSVGVGVPFNDPNQPPELRFTGYRADGSTVIQTIVALETSDTYTLLGFESLTKVEVTTGNYGFLPVLDNIIVELSPVPEPSTLLLCVLGAGVLMVRGRRSKRINQQCAASA